MQAHDIPGLRATATARGRGGRHRAGQLARRACLALVLLAIAVMLPARAAAAPSAPLSRAQTPTTKSVENLARDAKVKADRAAVQASHAVRTEPWLWLNAVGAVVSVVFLFAANVIRPRSLTIGGVRGGATHPWWLWLCCALMTFVVWQLVAGTVRTLPGLGNLSPGSPKLQALTMAGAYATGLGVAFMMVKLAGPAAKAAGLTFTARCLPHGFLAFLFVFPIVNIVGIGATALHQQFTGRAPDPIAHETLRTLADHGSDPWAWSLAILAVVAAPVYEELLFRGFIQTAILQMTSRPWISILLTSALFAGVHLLGETPLPWYAVAAVFTLSIGLGVALERTRRIGVPILVHVLFNLANVVMLIAIA